MTTYFARFEHGSSYIAVDGTGNSPFCLAPGWSPPPAIPNTLMSTGNMSNKYSGGSRKDQQFTDRNFSVPLHTNGDSAAETHQSIRDLISYITNALGDSSNKLYFVYNESNSVPYAPKWGQNHKYYEIKSADADLLRARLYSIAEIRSEFIPISIPLIAAPTATGLRQLVGSGTGALQEIINPATKLSRGVNIPAAYTNRFTNPVFGDSTWSTNWAAGAGITATENTEAAFVYAGSASAKLTRNGAAGLTWRAVINVGSINNQWVSCMCKLPDGSSPDSSILQLYYDTALTTTFQALGGGWYLLYAEVTGINANTDAGVVLTGDVETVYVDLFCLQTGVHFNWPGYGDLLDWGWTGTAHQSASSGTDARLRWDRDTVIDIGQGSATIAWTPFNDNSELAADIYLLSTDPVAGLTFRWVDASNVWRLSDGTNSASSAATTFTAFTTYIFHLTWGPDGLAVYINGVADGSTATYDPPAANDYVYLGTGRSVTNHSGGMYHDFVTYARVLTAAEILADYNNSSPYITGGDTYGQRLNTIPWLWTDDGDDTVDNCYDSTRENWGVAGGVPGDLPADTEWTLGINNAAYGGAIFLCNQPIKYMNIDILEFVKFFADCSGTALASCAGGEYETETVGSSSVAYPSVQASIYTLEQFGQNYYIYARMRDSGGNLTASLDVSIGGTGSLVRAAFQSVDPPSDDFSGHQIGPISFDVKNVSSGINPTYNNTLIYLSLIRTTGGGDVDIDYFMLMPDPLKLKSDAAMDSASYFVRGRNAYVMNTATNALYSSQVEATGPPKDLIPNVSNFLWVALGDDGIDNVITNTIDFIIYVTPRWSLM